jgi:hypothetical protein
MGKAGSGAKAGVVAGLVYGILDGIFSYILLVIFKADIMKIMTELVPKDAALGIHVTAAQLYSDELAIEPVEGVIGGLIIGLILGIIFAYTHNKIPGKNMIIKGEIFGIILWIIFNVIIGAFDIKAYGITYYMVSIALAIIALVAFGFVLGTLYNKWGINDVPVTDEEFNKTNS